MSLTVLSVACPLAPVGPDADQRSRTSAAPRRKAADPEFSYRGDPDIDRNDVARLAADCGFSVVRNGVSPFRFWDAPAFELTRAA